MTFIEESWLIENRGEIAIFIGEGWDEAQQGELTYGEQVRVELQQFKGDWIKQHRRA
jgi:hypothetical protein